MDIYTIAQMEALQAESNDPQEYDKVLTLKRKKNEQGLWEVCDCGSTEFFFAPIVHVRCNHCKRPLSSTVISENNDA